MTRKRFVELCMGRLGMSRNEANRIAKNRGSEYAIARTEVAIVAATIALSAMPRVMADLARALDEVR